MQERALGAARSLLTLPQFNRCLSYRLQGPLDVAGLKQAFAELLLRHEALRTAFTFRDQKPLALIAPDVDVNSFFSMEDVSSTTSVASERVQALLLKKVDLLTEQERLRPFQIDRTPLLRVRLLRLRNDDYVILLTIHDLIADGWSMSVFMEELSGLYAAVCTGRGARLPEPFQFSDFAQMQRLALAREFNKGARFLLEETPARSVAFICQQ